MTTTTKKPARAKLATKKKVSTKKTSPAKAQKDSGLTADSMLYVVAGSREPKLAKRKLIKKAVPASGIRAAQLTERADCTLRALETMVRKGFIEVR